jgi:hypothetical protein
MRYLLFLIVPTLIWGQIITVGDSCGNCATATTANYTWANLGNVAPATGLIDSVRIYLVDNESGGEEYIIIGTLYEVSTLVYSTRDSSSVRALVGTGGAYRTFALKRPIVVQAGDIIAFYSPTLNPVATKYSNDGSGTYIVYKANALTIGQDNITYSKSAGAERVAIFGIGHVVAEVKSNKHFPETPEDPQFPQW